MASDDKDWTTGNPASLGGLVNEDQNTTSTTTHDQTLIKALQDLIIRVIDPGKNNDMNQVHLGPEAGRLISALQEFISSIVVRSQSIAQNTIEVRLEEDENDQEVQGVEFDFDGNKEDTELSSNAGSISNPPSSIESDADEVRNYISWVRDTVEKPQLTFEEKLLRELREHVFNRIPIRLLCFEPRGHFNFQISLLERGDIYARLASQLLGKIHEQELRPQKDPWGQMETDEDAIKRSISKYVQYAILSHTWLRTAPGEVTYGDWNKGLFDSSDPGYRKLVNFCKAAWKDHQLAFGWMDTVCINKDSSSELDESIRSMYNWYSRAAVCIIYLAETSTLLDMSSDPWFTRGWTLQELLAPDIIKFYNSYWKRLVDLSWNDKEDKKITEQIERATSISMNELINIHIYASISRKMQLAATRVVTREEDIAYSLMGIFNVSFSTAYGEGAPRAFFRLLQEILFFSTDVLDILNWAGYLPTSQPHSSSILPSSPSNYVNRSSNKRLILHRPIEPLTLTPLGLRIPVILMPGISVHDTASEFNSIGSYNATVFIWELGSFSNTPTTRAYNLLDSRISGRDGQKKDSGYHQFTFAVFNFGGTLDTIYLPKICIAIALSCDEDIGKVSIATGINTIRTHEPVVFELNRRTAVHEEEPSDHHYWFINLMNWQDTYWVSMKPS